MNRQKPSGGPKEMLANALKRREELTLESEALDNLISMYRRLLSVEDSSPANHEEQPDLYRGESSRAKYAAQVAEMVDVARRLIIAEKRPMKRGELVKKLEAQGYQIVGGDKNKVFGTNLWRSKKFQSIEGKGYWPIDVKLPS